MKKWAALGIAAVAVYAASQQAVTAAPGLSGSPAANEALANSMATSGYGWTGSQITCLDELWTEESGFSADAANPTSDARGIPQNISGWSAGYQEGNAAQQIRWGLSYIAGRYGSPCAAWAHEKSTSPNWY